MTTINELWLLIYLISIVLLIYRLHVESKKVIRLQDTLNKLSDHAAYVIAKEMVKNVEPSTTQSCLDCDAINAPTNPFCYACGSSKLIRNGDGTES